MAGAEKASRGIGFADLPMRHHQVISILVGSAESRRFSVSICC